MMEQMKEILNEGGAKMDKVEVIDVVETPEVTTVEDVAEEVTEKTVVEDVAEFAKDDDKKEEGNAEGEEKKCPECGKPVAECACKKDDDDEDKKKYNLDEIVEYAELLAKYSELETNYSALNTEYDNLKAQNEDLVAFKKAAEKKDKEAMIDSFYMLSDEDKKEVIDNIDTYSVEDIEAKLSIICVRNKVNFNLDDDNVADSNETVFSLDSDYSDESVPAWIKAVRATAAQEI